MGIGDRGIGAFRAERFKAVKRASVKFMDFGSGTYDVECEDGTTILLTGRPQVVVYGGTANPCVVNGRERGECDKDGNWRGVVNPILIASLARALKSGGRTNEPIELFRSEDEAIRFMRENGIPVYDEDVDVFEPYFDERHTFRIWSRLSPEQVERNRAQGLR